MSGRAIRHLCVAAVLGALPTACGRTLPEPVKAAVETHRSTATEVADAAARVCVDAILSAPFQPDPMAAPPMPANPAIGTALASDPQVLDVLVTCSWPDPRDASGQVWGGTDLKRLRGASGPPPRPVTMAEDIVESSCKDDAKSCEQLIVPSRHHPDENTADLRIVRPTADGGRAEIIVVFVPAKASP